MNRTALLALTLAAATAVAGAQEFTATATPVTSFEIGTGRTQNAVTPGAGYSDVTNFSGFAFANGGAASTTVGTTAVMDDLNLSASSGAIGQNLGRIYFTVANLDSVDFTARVRIRFFDMSGSGGGPGTNTLAVSFNPITFTHGQVTVFSSDFTSFNFVLPANMWACEFFDGASGSTATVANLNNLGQGLFNPVDVGTSADVFFQTSAAGAPGNNPAGSFFNFGGNPVANFGWELNPVPEPASMAVLGIGALALIRRRRNRK